MSDLAPVGDPGSYAQQALALTGLSPFGLASSQPASMIMQVAPRPQPGLTISGERWDTYAGHHGYLDHYGNRCERFTLASGESRIADAAGAVLGAAAGRIEAGVP